MAKKKDNKDEKAELKVKKVEEEIERIKQSLFLLSTDLIELNEKLIYNAAWLAVSLDELTDVMNREGVITTYQNGANQFGTKKSPEAELYTNWTKQYQTIMKQLSDLLPKSEPPKQEDNLTKFIES